METKTPSRIIISDILVDLFALAFLVYNVWMMLTIHSYLKAVGVISLMMPFLISLWKQVTHRGKLTAWEKWIFIIVMLICWAAQSFLHGKLSHLLH